MPAALSATLAMMLGGVPINVHVPPRPAAKASGIIWRDTGRCASLQIPITTGIRQAVVPVLERKADMTAAIIMIPIISLISPVPKSLTTWEPMSWARPV